MLTTFIFRFIAVALFYLLTVFVTLQWNPLLWHFAARLVLAVLVVADTVWGIIREMKIFNEDLDSNLEDHPSGKGY